MKLNLRVATGHCQWGGASKPLPLPPLSQFTGRGKTAPPVLALMAEDLPLTNEEIRQMQALLPRQQHLLLLRQPRGAAAAPAAAGNERSTAALPWQQCQQLACGQSLGLTGTGPHCQ